MTLRLSIPKSCFATLWVAALCSLVLAQTTPAASPQQKHSYTSYEQLVYGNATQFHKNFNNHDWNKNGPLVADNLLVNSNGTILHGRDSFISRIARFAGPFPDVKITDLDTIVDGNKAAIRFVITGTQMGDLETPTGLLQATKRKMKIEGIEYFTFDKDGKLVDLVTVEDLAGMMHQLLMPGQ